MSEEVCSTCGSIVGAGCPDTTGLDNKPPMFADWEHPVFDGPQKEERKPLPGLNTENAGE